MYGLLCESLHDFIKESYGDDVWKLVRERADVRLHSFVTHQVKCVFPVENRDKFSLVLQLAASGVTGTPYNELMNSWGVYFLGFVGKYGYDRILKVLGRHVRDFVNGLDNLHEYLRFSYPKVQPPTFFCQEESATGVTLHYRSERRRVEGLRQTEVQMTKENMNLSRKILNSAALVSLMGTHLQLRVFSTEYITKTSPSSSKTFCFPSKCPHICIGKTREILKVISHCLLDYYMKKLHLHFSLNLFKCMVKLIFPLVFPTLFLSLCVCRMESLSAMFKTGLYINDLSMHDSSRDLVLAGTQQSEELKRVLPLCFPFMKMLDYEMKKTDDLLYRMIPKPVAKRLRKGEPVFPDVTILFSDVVGFTRICSHITPMQVVSMLNTMYTLFDTLSEKHRVFKVETIGDAYMVVAGAPEKTKYHAHNICDMALDMVRSIDHLKDPSNGNNIQIRVGIHSGMVVAGVVGHKMPRYGLHGDTVHTASAMESNGKVCKDQDHSEYDMHTTETQIFIDLAKMSFI
uniref:guanylate cyclase n=1 Tax=Sphaeramia orbicularis TaxID=375764 RepID=A0A672ZHU2_9TELE